MQASCAMMMAGADLETMAIEDIDAGLAANFEGSLSGLGVDLHNSAYNMSDALLALPCFGEALQHSAHNGNPSQVKLEWNSEGHPVSVRCVSQESIPIHQRIRTASQSSGQNSMKFQYALKAATSPAIKIEEESLTYMNQGQEYELVFKRLSENGPKTLYRSIVRVAFHERRMQYMEREHLDYWRRVRPGERLLDIDLPLSYGLRDAKIDRHNLNSIEIIWDSAVDCGIFLKLNCISTEFTAKKHGGEKGVPFRLTVDTLSCNTGEHLHSAAAQVKVFKPKGADRKHKTDREKVDRRPPSEQNAYQPASDLTYLQEVPYQPIPEVESASPAPVPSKSPVPISVKPVKVKPVSSSPKRLQSPIPRSPSVDHANRRTSFPLIEHRVMNSHGATDMSSSAVCLNQVGKKSPEHDHPFKQDFSPVSGTASSPPDDSLCSLGPLPELSIYSTAQDVLEWLQLSRFNALVPVFQNFAGADILRLTRADLVEICGTSDGIRLSNALLQKPPRPKLTLYFCCNSETLYHAVYLYTASLEEMHQRIATLFQADISHISSILLCGPGGISVGITSEVIRNIVDQSRFTLHVVSDTEKNGQYRIILKPDTISGQPT